MTLYNLMHTYFILWFQENILDFTKLCYGILKKFKILTVLLCIVFLILNNTKLPFYLCYCKSGLEICKYL